MRHFALTIWVTVALTGCASTVYFVLNPQNEKEATIYIIRKYAEPLLWNLHVYIDEQEAASLSNNSFVAFSIPSGVHTITLNWPDLSFMGLKLEKKIYFEGNSSRYFVIGGESRLYPGYMYSTGRSSLNLAEVSGDHGKRLIREVKKD